MSTIQSNRLALGLMVLAGLWALVALVTWQPARRSWRRLGALHIVLDDAAAVLQPAEGPGKESGEGTLENALRKQRRPNASVEIVFWPLSYEAIAG